MLYVYKEITRPTPYIREEKHFHFNFDLVQILIIVHESFHHIYFHATLVLVWPGHKSWENCMQTLVCQLLWIVTPCSVEQGLYGCGILHVGSPRFIFCPCITMPWSKLTDYLHVSCVFTLEKYLFVVMCSEILCCLVLIYWDPMRR